MSNVTIFTEGNNGYIFDGEVVCSMVKDGYCVCAQGFWAIGCETDVHPSIDQFQTVPAETGIFECDGCGDSFEFIRF